MGLNRLGSIDEDLVFAGQYPPDGVLKYASLRTCVGLSLYLERTATRVSGVYEHFYTDSVFGKQVSTHYLVLAHHLKLAQESIKQDDCQHADVIWTKPNDLHLLQTHTFTLVYLA